MALAYKIPYFSKEKQTSPADPASSEVQALSISPLAGEQRAASAGGAIGSPGGAARRPRRPGDPVAYAVGERLAERVGVADARRGVAPADDLVADAGDVHRVRRKVRGAECRAAGQERNHIV